MNTNTQGIAESSAGTGTLLEQVTGVGLDWGFRIIGFLLVLIIGLWLAMLIRKGLVKAMEKREVDPTLIHFLAALAHIALKIFVIIAALAKLNIQTASFIAILGAAGLAVGLALQGSLSNFASGVLMIIFKPIAVGDFVEVGGALGGVQEIGIFTTILKAPDNKRVILPNAQVMGGKIINFNANKTRRVDLIASIGYDDDIDKAKSVLKEIVAGDDRILKDPEPVVTVVEMADSSINFAVRPWCNASDYWGVMCDTTETIKKRFDEEGISIPFPQRDVHIYEHKGE